MLDGQSRSTSDHLPTVYLIAHPRTLQLGMKVAYMYGCNHYPNDAAGMLKGAYYSAFTI